MDKKQPLPYVEVGDRLAEARKLLGYTQAALSKNSGVSYGSISAYERGVNLPKIGAIEKLEAAGINMQYVLNGAGKPVLLVHQRPMQVLMEPSKDQPGMHTIREVGPSYELRKGDRIIDNIEEFVAASREAVKKIEELLKKIKFQNAHILIRNTLAQLLQHEKITIDAAETVLVLMRDDHEFHEELLENERKKNAKK